jgi:uncharacterized protein
MAEHDLPFGIPSPARPPRAAWDAAMAHDLSAARTIEVAIPLRDGVELAADVHLPPAARLPAPAIVLGTPYDKSSPIEDMRPYRDAGYVAIAYDVRGRGKSEGLWHAFAHDAQDGHDVVEWVAAQEWCSGEVGVSGLSYSAWVACATMSQRPPHLRAAIVTSPPGRWMQEIPYTFGCFQLYFAYWFGLVRRRFLDNSRDVAALVDILPLEAIGEALDCRGPSWQEFLEHDTLDELWRSRRWDGGYDFDVPCLHVTGWHDREDIHGAFHHYEQMLAGSPARERQWLLVGPWSHVSARHPSDRYLGVEAPGGSIDMQAIHVRFYDRFLRGADNGVEDVPRVQLYDPGDPGWKVRPAWRAGTAERRLYLAGERALEDAPGPDGEDAYVYDPLDPAGVRFDVRALPWEPPLDLRELESQAGVVTWSSAPLEHGVTVHGWGELELFASTDCEDTEWHVKLADVDPDGRSLCVAWGCLRASHAKGLEARTPVVPGEVARYAIELSPAFHTFKRGHRVRVVLASSDFPWFARNLNQPGPIARQSEPRVATNTVHRGAARPSCLRIPVEA